MVKALRHGPIDVMRDLLGPYDALLKRWLRSDLTRGPVSAFAAHAIVGPNVPGGALFAFWQAAYHLFGQWHARGGSGALIAALVRRLNSYGGRVRCAAPVARIDASGGKIRAVVLEDGEVIETGAVITAIDPKNEVCTPLLLPGRGFQCQAAVVLAQDHVEDYIHDRSQQQQPSRHASDASTPQKDGGNPGPMHRKLKTEREGREKEPETFHCSVVLAGFGQTM